MEIAFSNETIYFNRKCVNGLLQIKIGLGKLWRPSKALPKCWLIISRSLEDIIIMTLRHVVKLYILITIFASIIGLCYTYTVALVEMNSIVEFEVWSEGPSTDLTNLIPDVKLG